MCKFNNSKKSDSFISNIWETNSDTQIKDY